MSELMLGSEIGDRITQIRGKTTLPDFAASLGIARSSLIRYEKGDRLPDAEFINLICQKYKIDANWLIAGIGTSPFTEVDTDPVAIPVYDVEVSAGYGAFADQDVTVTYVNFQKSWLKQNIGVNPRNVDIVYARGDSMETAIEDGDMLLVDREINSLKREGVYVFRLDGYLQVKRLQRQPGKTIRVTSDNSAYEPFTILNKEEIKKTKRENRAYLGREV